MDEWRQALQAMESGKPLPDLAKNNHKSKNEKRKSRFDNDDNTRNNSNHGGSRGSSNQREKNKTMNASVSGGRSQQQFVGMSQAAAFASMKRPQPLIRQEPNIDGELAMIDNLNHEFMAQLHNPLMGFANNMNSNRRGRTSLLETPQMENNMNMAPRFEADNRVPQFFDSSNMNMNIGNMDRNLGNMDRNMGNMDRNRGNMDMNLGSMDDMNRMNINDMDPNRSNMDRNRSDMDRQQRNMDRNQSNMDRNGSDLDRNRSIDRNMDDVDRNKDTRGRKNRGNERYSPSASYNEKFDKEQEILNRIRAKEEEIRKKYKSNNEGQANPASRNSDTDRDRAWPSSFSENDSANQALDNVVFNNPAVIDKMNRQRNPGASGRKTLLGNAPDNDEQNQFGSSSGGFPGQFGDMLGSQNQFGVGFQDQFGGQDQFTGQDQFGGASNVFQDQFGGMDGMQTLMDTMMNAAATMDRMGNNVWDQTSMSGRGGSMSEKRDMVDLKDELKQDINFRFKDALKSLGPRKEESVKNFNWQCFKVCDYEGIRSKYLTCHDCDVRVDNAESFMRHLTGMKHKNKMIEIERHQNSLIREYRYEVKKLENSSDDKKADFCALCECKVQGDIVRHRSKYPHKSLKAYIHPFDKITSKEYDGRPEYQVHKYHPDYIRILEKERITKSVEVKGDTDFMEALHQIKETNKQVRDHRDRKEKERRSKSREKEDKTSRSKERASDKKNKSSDSNKNSSDKTNKKKDNDDDILEIVVVDKKEKETPKPVSPMESLAMGDLNTYDENKGVGKQFLRPVSGYFCKVCKKLLHTEEESVSHLKSKPHWDACVKAENTPQTKKRAAPTASNENDTPAKQIKN